MLQTKLPTETPIQVGVNLYIAIIATASALPILVGAIVLGDLAGGLGEMLPRIWGLGLVALAIGAAVLDEGRRWWLYVIAGGLVLTTLAWLLQPALITRASGTVIFGTIAGVAVWQAYGIVSTYAEYLLANPSMPRGRGLPGLDCSLSCYVAGGYMAIFLIVPPASVASATVLSVALALSVFATYVSSTDDLKTIVHMFHVWADAQDAAQENSWRPGLPRWERLGILFVAVLSITITFVIATSYGSCFEAEGERPYDWLPLIGLYSDPDWRPAQSVILTLLTPIAILVSILLPALDQVCTWQQAAREQAATDVRSELDKLIDKGGAE